MTDNCDMIEIKNENVSPVEMKNSDTEFHLTNEKPLTTESVSAASEKQDTPVEKQEDNGFTIVGKNGKAKSKAKNSPAQELEEPVPTQSTQAIELTQTVETPIKAKKAYSESTGNKATVSQQKKAPQTGKPSKFGGNTNTRPYKNRNTNTSQKAGDATSSISSTSSTPNTAPKPSVPRKSEAEREREHQAYVERIGKARAICLAELLLPPDWLESKYDEMRYMINERTGRPNDAIFISVDKVASIVSKSQEIQKLEENITIDEQVFSRERFYRNWDFQDELKAYYSQYKFGCRLNFQQRSGKWNLLVTW